MRLRPATAADVPAMMALEQHTPSAGHWSRQQYKKLFESAVPSQTPKRFALVAEDGEPPAIVAFLVSHNIDAEWELENIVVAETARRRGLGTLLLSELIAYARTRGGIAIFLEVRESNHNARSLYKKLGFEEQALRKNYYSHPPEHAFIYRLPL
jgi:[ribosomal protein S18]-alanine N-acetyltransferase